jgi:hypothetical protein
MQDKTILPETCHGNKSGFFFQYHSSASRFVATSAIQSGNLSAAQSAYATLSQAQSNQGSGPFSQALSQIGDALQSGDIGKAQAALASLQQQMQAMTGAHHHHGHHHAGGADQSQAATAAVSTNGDPTTSRRPRT